MNPGASQTLEISSFLLDMYHAFLSSVSILHHIQALKPDNGHLGHANSPSVPGGVWHALRLQPASSSPTRVRCCSSPLSLRFSTLVLPHLSMSQVDGPTAVRGGWVPVVEPLLATRRVVAGFSCYWVAAVPAALVSFLMVVVLRVVWLA